MRGQLSFSQLSSSDSDEDDDDDYWMNTVLPDRVSKFWRLWMLELKEGCRALVPLIGDDIVYYRIISVVIAFLGPWRDFGVADGPHWNRGRPRPQAAPWGRYCVGNHRG